MSKVEEAALLPVLPDLDIPIELFEGEEVEFT